MEKVLEIKNLTVSYYKKNKLLTKSSPFVANKEINLEFYEGDRRNGL